MRMLAHFGGAQALLKKGRRVLLKPNLLMARPPNRATTAHPAVVLALCRALTDAGAEVLIADSPGGPYNNAAIQKVYKDCGMLYVSHNTGAQLNRDFSHRERTYSGILPRTFELITPVFEADVIISISKMKTHMFMHFTGAVKNLFGTIPGLKKATFHSMYPEKADFAKMLVDLCSAVGADFHIMDGIEGMDGEGPSGGRVRQAGVLLGAQNPFALDHAAMCYCGIDLLAAPVHQAALAAGLDCAYTLIGDAIEPLEEPYHLPVKKKGGLADRMAKHTPRFLQQMLLNRARPYPVISSRCVGCGDCARACPEGAITVTDGKAQVNTKKCIRCYCCHELCPILAVDLS